MPIIANSWDVRVWSPITKNSQDMVGHQIPKITEAHECHQLCENPLGTRRISMLLPIIDDL